MPAPQRDATPLQRLGATIRQYRRQRGMTQQAVARQAGLDATYLSQLEHGRHNVTILSLLQIAQALQIPLSHLLQPLDALVTPHPLPPDDGS